MVRAIAALLLVLPLAVSAQTATPPPAEPPRAAEPTAPAAPATPPPAEPPPAAEPTAPAAPAPAETVTTPAPAASTPGPAAAPAPVAPAKVAAAAEPNWSFGAGVGFGGTYLLGGLGIIGGGTNAPTLSPQPYWPVLVTSLERRLGGSTWLVLGASGWFYDDRTAWENTDLTTPAEVRRYGVQLSTGLRRALTRAGSPVDVSILALAEGGFADGKLERSTGGIEDELSWIVGASLGFAVERTLVDRLSLRLATPVVGVRYAKSEIDAPGNVRVTSTRASADFALAPRLELRLAF